MTDRHRHPPRLLERPTRTLGALALGLVCAPPARAVAQQLPGAADAELLQDIAKLIRWTGVLSSLFVVFAAYVALRFVRNSVERLSHQFTTRRLVFQKVETFFQFIVYVVTSVLVITLSLRLDQRIVAVIGGTVAVAVGLSIKDLVASFIAGIMVMIDRPFQVGDRVEFGGQYGDITAIGLRSVRMQTLDDNTVTIPNNKFLTDVTSSGNYGALDMQVGMSFYIGLDQDVEKARQIITEAAVSSRHIYLPKPVVVLVQQVLHDNYVAIHLRLKAYVNDTRYEKAFETDINLRVLHAFRDAQILPPAILHRSV
ncbi:MAG: mechanosensitive ion channel [Sandaracinaceae bacterium]|nr:mechanosensitive ion channel [Myxococcales bacterium]MCB9656127.1 mechanosensitive ion channel [Sandaracinaceae bacterium]